MRRERPGEIRDRLADRLRKFRPVKQLRRRVAAKVVAYFAIAVVLIGMVAGLVAALVGGV